MFHHIKGIVTDIEPNLVCIECCGIGFAVNVSLNTMSYYKVGEEAKILITEVVKEDSFDLYGFANKLEKRCFDLLISVSGIGPKAAISILSSNTPDMLIMAITTGNEKSLTSAPGIGKKTAQRVILDLKDKLGSGFDIGTVSAPVKSGTAGAATMAAGSKLNDAVAALTMLGYSNADIAPILKTLDTESLTVEQIIKAVLKHM